MIMPESTITFLERVSAILLRQKSPETALPCEKLSSYICKGLRGLGPRTREIFSTLGTSAIINWSAVFTLETQLINFSNLLIPIFTSLFLEACFLLVEMAFTSLFSSSTSYSVIQFKNLSNLRIKLMRGGSKVKNYHQFFELCAQFVEFLSNILEYSANTTR